MKKKILSTLLTISVLGVLLLTGCGNTGAGQQTVGEDQEENSGSQQKEVPEEEAGERKKVVIGQASGSEIFNEILGIAQLEGFIEEELHSAGYEPEYVFFAGGGPEANEAVVADAVDFVVVGDFPAIVGKSNNIGASVIAVLDSATNESYLVRAEDDTIQTIADIEGKKVNVQRGTSLHYLYSKIVEEYDLDPSKIEEINAASDAQAAFLNGEIDVYPTVDIFAQPLVDSGEARVIFSTGKEHSDWAYQVVLTGRDEYMEENPEAAIALNRAIIRAYRFATANPEQAYEDLTQNGKYSIDLIKEVYSENNNANGTFEFFDGDISEENIQKFQDTIDFMKEQELIVNDVDASDLVNTEFYEKALSELGE